MTTYRSRDGVEVRTWPSTAPGRVLVRWTLPSGYGGGTECASEAEALRVAREHVAAWRGRTRLADGAQNGAGRVLDGLGGGGRYPCSGAGASGLPGAALAARGNE